MRDKQVMNFKNKKFSKTKYFLPQCTRAGGAHREADGREYHPVSRLAGMRVWGQVGRQAYSKITIVQACKRKGILRLPCQAALQDGRAGGISMSLEFLVLFFQEKSTEKNYDPVIARFFSPDNYVQIPEFTQSFNRYSYCLNNPLKYVDPTGMLVEYNSGRDRWNSFWLRVFDKQYREDFRELMRSEEIYVLNFNGDGKNNLSTDGIKLYVNYSMTNRAKEAGNNLLSLLKHEYMHGMQHLNGEIEFVNVDQGWGIVDRDGNYFEHRKWTPVNNDIYKEIEAHDAGAKAPFLKGGTNISRWLFDNIDGIYQQVPLSVKIERLQNTPEYKNLPVEHLYNKNKEKIKDYYQYALPYKIRLYKP